MGVLVTVSFFVYICMVMDFCNEDKANGVKFSLRFIGIQGMESHIFVNFAPPEAQNRMSHPACVPLPNHMVCGREIDMCGHNTSVPEDGRTYLNISGLYSLCKVLLLPV